MKPEIIDLFDQYTHSAISRRLFFSRLTALAGGTAAATALLGQLKNNYANAATVDEATPDLSTQMVTYPGATGDVRGYLAMPAEATEPLPAVIVIHENRGLNPHIEDVVRRVALAGYVALGPDFLSPAGGTPSDEDLARDQIGELDSAETLANAQASLDFLQSHDATTDEVGCMGFCWGGALTNELAVNAPTLGAAIAFYGRVAPTEAVPNLEAPLLLHYAGRDDRINDGIPEFEAALRAAGKEYTLCMYRDTDHAFHNDTNPARYDAVAAQLAWTRTLAFLDWHLKPVDALDSPSDETL
jgi:carboxymethylenebutenolidase